MEDSDFFIPGGLLESMGADDFGGDDAMMLSMEGVNPRAKEFTPTLPSATPSKTNTAGAFDDDDEGFARPRAGSADGGNFLGSPARPAKPDGGGLFLGGPPLGRGAFRDDFSGSVPVAPGFGGRPPPRRLGRPEGAWGGDAPPSSAAAALRALARPPGSDDPRPSWLRDGPGAGPSWPAAPPGVPPPRRAKPEPAPSPRPPNPAPGAARGAAPAKPGKHADKGKTPKKAPGEKPKLDAKAPAPREKRDKKAAAAAAPAPKAAPKAVAEAKAAKKAEPAKKAAAAPAKAAARPGRDGSGEAARKQPRESNSPPPGAKDKPAAAKKAPAAKKAAEPRKAPKPAAPDGASAPADGPDAPAPATPAAKPPGLEGAPPPPPTAARVPKAAAPPAAKKPAKAAARGAPASPSAWAETLARMSPAVSAERASTALDDGVRGLLGAHASAFGELGQRPAVTLCLLFPFVVRWVDYAFFESLPYWSAAALWNVFLFAVLPALPVDAGAAPQPAAPPPRRGSSKRLAGLRAAGRAARPAVLAGAAPGGDASDGPRAPDDAAAAAAKKAAVFLLRFLVQLGLFVESARSRSFLLALDGSELLVVAYALAALKASCAHEPVFLLSWSLHVVARAALGPGKLLIYAQLLTSLTSLRACRTKP